jgi:hypothetical protein
MTDRPGPIYTCHIGGHGGTIRRNGEPFLVLGRANADVSPKELREMAQHIVNLLNDAAGVSRADPTP